METTTDIQRKEQWTAYLITHPTLDRQLTMSANNLNNIPLVEKTLAMVADAQRELGWLPPKPAVYTIERDTTDHRKNKGWVVRKGTELLKYSERDTYPKTFKTKKLAQTAADNDAAYDAWLVRLFAQDTAGVYEWNAAEIEEIEKFTARLVDNPPQWTMNGQHPFQTIARLQHDSDAETLTKTGWINPQKFYAEKRRVMAARTEAFKRAGLTL